MVMSVRKRKKNISRVIEETGYQPSSQAQRLRTKKTKLVGVILPKIDSNTISREVAGISDILTKKRISADTGKYKITVLKKN